jgi:hypothetical protein
MSNSNPYGTDIGIFPNAAANGAYDVDLGMSEVTGRTLLVQRLIKRQTTPLGSVVDSPNDCMDVRGWVSSDVTQLQLQALAAGLKTELLKEEAVTNVIVMFAYNAATKTLTITENFTSGYGPFTLTLNVSQLTLTILLANETITV